MLRLVCDNCDSDLQHISLLFDELTICLSDKDMLSMCHKFPNIEIFQILSINLSMNETCLRIVVENMRKLEVLTVFTWDMNTEREFLYRPHTREYFAKICPNIERLELPGYMLTESAVNNLAKQSLPQFKSLRIFDLNTGNINAIQLICDNFPTLKPVLTVRYMR